MTDLDVKASLHEELRYVRAAVLAKLDDLSPYDVRRPLTASGTNLLGLVKHLTAWEARYFGLVFDRPWPGELADWRDEEAHRAAMWATEHETRQGVRDAYAAVCAHADATIEALALDAPGHVPWWPRPDVTLFTILVHMLTETARHAGHADILREQVDGSLGVDAQDRFSIAEAADMWEARRAVIEAAARAARD